MNNKILNEMIKNINRDSIKKLIIIDNYNESIYKLYDNIYEVIFNNKGNFIQKKEKNYEVKLNTNDQINHCFPILIECMPVFIEGIDALPKFIIKNTNYPQIAREKGIKGKVYVSFVITASGSIENIKVIKGLCEECDAEAIRVIQMMSGKWKPGMINKVAVPVQFTLPVKFDLDDNKSEKK
ncbi:MAG: energy transducer TonB [Bacteroidales bacterium]|nr:energy transducer TonB [Bacteroidales bacterium]